MFQRRAERLNRACEDRGKERATLQGSTGDRSGDSLVDSFARRLAKLESRSGTRRQGGGDCVVDGSVCVPLLKAPQF